jgi:hypothetical protein
LIAFTPATLTLAAAPLVRCEIADPRFITTVDTVDMEDTVDTEDMEDAISDG